MNSWDVPVWIPPDVGIELFNSRGGCHVENVIPFENGCVAINKDNCAALIVAFDEISPPASWKTTVLRRGGSRPIFQGGTETKVGQHDHR